MWCCCSLFSDACHRSLLNLRRRRHMEVARLRATNDELVHAKAAAPTPEDAPSSPGAVTAPAPASSAQGPAAGSAAASESAEAVLARLLRFAEMQVGNWGLWGCHFTGVTSSKPFSSPLPYYSWPLTGDERRKNARCGVAPRRDAVHSARPALAPVDDGWGDPRCHWVYDVKVM